MVDGFHIFIRNRIKKPFATVLRGCQEEVKGERQ
jgi:hypothetical protein